MAAAGCGAGPDLPVTEEPFQGGNVMPAGKTPGILGGLMVEIPLRGAGLIPLWCPGYWDTIVTTPGFKGDFKVDVAVGIGIFGDA